MTQEVIDEHLKLIDLNKDGKISFKEYLQFMKKTKEHKKVDEKRIQNKAGKGIIKIGNSGESMAYQQYSEEERAAYVKVINLALGEDEVCKKYLPIDPNSDEVFTRFKNGVLLCKLINRIQEGTIDDRAINIKDNMNVFNEMENLKLGLSAAKSVGIKLIGVNQDTFREVKKIPILGILWQIVKMVVLEKVSLKKYPQLVRLLKDGEELNDLLKLSPENLLLRWFNFHLKNANYPKEIKNFEDDVKDSEKYIVLLNQLDKEKCSTDGLQEQDLNKRAQIVLDNSKKIGTESYITPKDIVAGNKKLNTLFTAAIFNSCSGLDPPTEQEAYEAAKLLEDDKEGTREERTYRMWINCLGLKDGNINNLYEECKDGLLLLSIIDKISPGTVNWKVVEKNPNNPFKKAVNCKEVVESCRNSKYEVYYI